MRLRVRQYRYPGLKEWKVFEIAAALPLLLQLALFLFFVGLCFFTAQIDAQMGHTSLPLVAAWILFLGLTTLGPLVSSRCPYKLLLLKKALKWARQWTRPALSPNLHRIAQLFTRGLNSESVTAVLSFLDFFAIPKDPDEDEEDIAIKGSQEDSEILLSIDTMIQDDGLLAVMLDTLQQLQPKPENMISFIISCINNRIPLYYGHEFAQGHLSTIPNLSALSQHAYNAIIERVAGILQGVGQPLTNTVTSDVARPVWIKDAILLLMSISSFPLPENAYSAIVMCINDNNSDSLAGTEVGSYLRESAEDSLLLRRISDILCYICKTQQLSNTCSVLQVYNGLLPSRYKPESKLIFTIRNYEDQSNGNLSNEVLQFVWHPCLEILKHDINSKTSTPGFFDAVHGCIHLAVIFNKIDEFLPIYISWCSPTNAWRCMAMYSSLHKKNRIPVKQLLFLIEKIVTNSDSDSKFTVSC